MKTSNSSRINNNTKHIRSLPKNHSPECPDGSAPHAAGARSAATRSSRASTAKSQAPSASIPRSTRPQTSGRCSGTRGSSSVSTAWSPCSRPWPAAWSSRARCWRRRPLRPQVPPPPHPLWCTTTRMLPGTVPARRRPRRLRPVLSALAAPGTGRSITSAHALNRL